MQISKPGRRVLIVGGDAAVSRLFQEYGWLVTNDWDEADLFQFTGGPDVDPSYYLQSRHPTTYPSAQRDEVDEGMFRLAVSEDIPMAGICRGAQFLCVMTGGSLWQDVDGHAGGLHTAWCPETRRTIVVNSTHHQVMRPAEHHEVLLVSDETDRWADGARELKIERIHGGQTPEYLLQVEVLADHKNRIVCFQPHPEYENCPSVTKNLYFDTINRVIFGES